MFPQGFEEVELSADLAELITFTTFVSEEDSFLCFCLFKLDLDLLELNHNSCYMMYLSDSNKKLFAFVADLFVINTNKQRSTVSVLIESYI